MKWTGDPETDLILSLADESGTAILGQVNKDGAGAGWHAYDYYANNGHLGLFDTPQQAKMAVGLAVVSSIEGRKMQ